jgi:2-methylcitrate dehydratase PrpD
MFPNVTSIHAALDAMRSILIEEELEAADIAGVHVGCGHMTFVHTAWPYRPAGVTAAQMNMYYGLSVMALRRDVTAADYREADIASPQLLDFMSKIRIEEDAELESRGPAFRHAARVRLQTTDGRSFAREILHRRGSPENPVNWDDIERKFSANIAGLLAPDAGKKLLDCCVALENLAKVTAITDTLAAPFPAGAFV